MNNLRLPVFFFISISGVVTKNRRTHQIIDYAVVPVFGCEVKVTVNEIVTNAWLVSIFNLYVLKVYDCEL